MRILMASMLLIAGSWAPGAVADDKDRVARQQELNAACEAARAKKLAVVRRRLVAECVNNEQRGQDDCAAEYSNYGERAGNRAPLFYDLPECEAALEYQKSTRSSR